MQFKELEPFLKYIDKLSFQDPQVLLVSGKDMAVSTSIRKRLQKRLEEQVGTYEWIAFSNELEEGLRLQSELENIPLFGPFYRVLLVHHAQEVLRGLNTGKTKNTATPFGHALENLPPNLILLLFYEGVAPQYLLKVFTKSSFAHLSTREIYADKLERTLRSSISNHGIKLSEEAFYFLLENVEAKQGSMEGILAQLASSTPRNKEIPLAEVQSILKPISGWDIFALIDALFAGHLQKSILEYKQFNPNNDNIFVLLTLILQRLNQIRWARVCYQQRMPNSELISFLGLEKIPKFVQDKILKRLRQEAMHYDEARQERIYKFLMRIHKNFRSQVSIARQLEYFQVESLKAFGQ